jgi:regulator of sirC expression with transglutaminase-like and TPR domain
MQHFFVLIVHSMLLAWLAFSGSSAHAKDNSANQAIVIGKIHALLSTPEAQLDLANAKLSIDRMIDPSINMAATSNQLNGMAAQARTLVPPNASKRETLHALQVYLYVAGPWNKQQPYKYDLDDPLGKNIRNKLLTTYLVTRKGNCVSMPLLFIILGQKLGLDVTAARAPLHIFVKFRDEKGQITNVEATSGGFKQDASYEVDFPMTKQAIANGLYLRRLSKRETVTIIIDTLQEFNKTQGLYERRITIADAVLKVYPKDVTSMLVKGFSYYKLLEKNFINKYPTPAEIPLEERAYYQELGLNNRLWFNNAEALGWREQTEADDAKYLRTIEKVKAKQ